MAREKKNLKGSKKLKTDLNDQEEERDLNDTQENTNKDLKDLGEENEQENSKKDLNDLGEEEDDSEKDQKDSEEDSDEDDGLDDIMNKNNLGFQRKTKRSKTIRHEHTPNRHRCLLETPPLLVSLALTSRAAYLYVP